VASDLLELLPAAAAELTAFRWSTYDVPFWARPNSRDGRWNYADVDSTQYWSLTPSAAWAALIRHENLRTEADLDLVRMPFWVCRVPPATLVDLRLAQERERHQVSEEALIDDDWSACQQLAVRLREHVRGVIAPSAALPEHANLTLFGRRRAIDWEHRPALASTIPASRAAIGRPPADLVDRVRRLGPTASGDRLF
jgi:RES domain-containing protein